MKLYATTTSERASKGQGGNKRLDTLIKIGDRDRVKYALNIGVSEDGNRYRLALVDMRDCSQDKTVFVVEEDIYTKGEKKKGEAICARRDCTIKEHKHSWMK